MKKINELYKHHRVSFYLLISLIVSMIFTLILKNTTIYTVVFLAMEFVLLNLVIVYLMFKLSMLYYYAILISVDTIYLLIYKFSLEYLIVFTLVIFSLTYIMNYINHNIERKQFVVYDIIYILLKILYIAILIVCY